MTLSDVVDGFDALRPGDSERFAAMEEVVLHYQRRNNPVVAAYGASRYLPIDAFKHAPVCTFDPEDAEAVFLSSGTGATGSGGTRTGTGATGSGGGSRRSRHYVRDLDLYHRSIDAGFEAAFGTGPFTFVAHLPVYESQGEQSSLVVMARRIAERFGNSVSGLFLDDDHVLKTAIAHAASSGERLILLGAAFGLLDLIESGRAPRLPEDSTIVETGGMKTHRRSVGRTDLHARLSDGFGVNIEQVRSEYGMCE
ncbi:MAG: hypothetical protein HKN17_01885, partial [Rhodothermales bacterium]|nr:hypothetical protein [Rhodothermales bacterium]